MRPRPARRLEHVEGSGQAQRRDVGISDLRGGGHGCRCDGRPTCHDLPSATRHALTWRPQRANGPLLAAVSPYQLSEAPSGFFSIISF
jgi:hypothetical protein